MVSKAATSEFFNRLGRYRNRFQNSLASVSTTGGGLSTTNILICDGVTRWATMGPALAARGGDTLRRPPHRCGGFLN